MSKLARARRVVVSGAWLAALAGAALPAAAQNLHAQLNQPVFIQWWENRWSEMENRVPDFFVAGYGALWLPPVHKAASAASVGYDPFDRFDLGRPGAPTAYGTEQEFRAVVAELQQANGLVMVDIVMNHNSGRTTDRNFWLAGGYPGFWGGPVPASGNKRADDNWGDFNNNPSGGCCTFLQSENPGGANYNLLNGDLVALVDIAHQNGGAANQFIRQPVAAGNPQNIPAGTTWNRPDPNNAAFYPDRQLTPVTFVNPGTPRNPGMQNITIYPYNLASPLAGDAVVENQNDYLTRWTQWMLDVYKVDGFRIDAIKHTPTWFFDRIWDNAAYLRRTTPWGAKITPFSFGESVEGNAFTFNNYVRKDSFANRDALDLNGAGQLRNIIGAGGFGDWANVLSAHLDNADDGLNNGTLGVNHTFSHDNGSVGNGSSQPPIPTRRQQGYAANAYLLLRNGVPIIYHNARGISRPGGFWPREGSPTALGVDPLSNSLDDTTTNLVQIRNQYGRGDFRPLTPTGGGGSADVLVFERFRNGGPGNFSANLVVGVNDRYDGGTDTRTVTTSFPAGTRLVELTGNATDAVVDPTNAVADVITVGAGGSVTITVPRNLNGSNVEHNKGFVAYGPAVPNATLTVAPVASTIAADPNTVTTFRRRITPVPVVTAPSFTLALATSPVLPLADDPDVDNFAAFRIDQGFRDFNGNGSVDRPPTDQTIPGFELFLTTNLPGVNNPAGQGLYEQTIDTSLLSEGYHYISAYAFKRRPANTDPLFRDARLPIYVDRQPPAAVVELPTGTVTQPSFEIVVRPQDRTASDAFLLVNLPQGVDPLSQIGPSNRMTRRDRFDYRRSADVAASGQVRITVVVTEDSGNAAIFDSFVTVELPCYANCDGSTGSPRLTPSDFVCFLNRYRAGDPYSDCDQSGGSPAQTPADFVCFLTQFRAGCP